MSNRLEGGVALCVAVCVAVTISAVSIAALVIASTDGDNPCQGHDKLDLSLQDWLIGYGASNFGFLGLICIAVGLSLKNPGVGMFTSVLCAVLYVLFGVIWSIIGIVILARSHNKCVADGTDIGIMTIIAIVFGPLVSSCGLQSRGG